MPGMLDTDETHLNGYGNRVLSAALSGPILQKWLRVKTYKPKMEWKKNKNTDQSQQD